MLRTIGLMMFWALPIAWIGAIIYIVGDTWRERLNFLAILIGGCGYLALAGYLTSH
jgi:hypothetical protein